MSNIMLKRKIKNYDLETELENWKKTKSINLFVLLNFFHYFKNYLKNHILNLQELKKMIRLQVMIRYHLFMKFRQSIMQKIIQEFAMKV